MKRRDLSIGMILVLVLACGAMAQESRDLALTQFKASVPGVGVYSDAAGRVVRLYGKPLQHGVSPADSAARFVADHAAVFGTAVEDLSAVSPLRDSGATQGVMFNPETGEYKFTLVYYAEFKDSIPVFRSSLRLLVRNDVDYPVVMAASALRGVGEFEVDRSIAAKSFDPAVDADTGMTMFSAPETVIWAGIEDMTASPRLAVTFIGKNDRTDEGYEAWRFVCDAATGEILHQETLIHFVDVTGNVQGMATPGAKAAFCTDEILSAYPWARVDIQGGSSVYADGAGNFTIPNSGSSAVTVRSYVDGLYFSVENRAGAEETLSQVVTPPGPANFIHNEPNTDDLVLAQVNIYVAGNQCRDWLLSYNPSFPGVVTETGVPTIVNRTDVYCPCNAWSDGSDGSINFCQADTCGPNTAWQSVLNHEYGHHCIDFTSSGQGEYGEGMADCFSMLPVDDPNLGYGFSGDCNSGLRTADNNCQYLVSGCSTCGSEIHDCGQLLSGCVWSIRNELVITEPVDYLDILSDIVVNSILLHTGTSINAQIPIDFLTLDDNDGNLANGTPHYYEICAGFGAHNLPCPELEIGLSVSPTSNFDASGDVGGPFTPSSKIYTVENLGPGAITYEVTTPASWLTLTNGAGTLPTVGSTALVTVAINATADSFPVGRYNDTVTFLNLTDGVGDTVRQVNLAVGIPDECGSAITACPGTYSETTVGMTNDGSASCGDTNDSPDIWYSYTPASGGSATFSMCSGTTYDAAMSVHSGCPGTTANELACDDDTCSSGGPPEITMSVTADTTYLIRVTGWNGSAGSFTLQITGPDCGDEALSISLPGGAPDVFAPGLATPFTVSIEDGTENYVLGSGTLHYRYDGGIYQTASLIPLGGDLYEATLPPATCAATPEFYVSAQGDLGTTVTSPGTAPSSVYSAVVGSLMTVMSDNFETDQGWTVQNSSVSDGAWERGVPAGSSGARGDPLNDYDGSSRCYVTGNGFDQDLDGGPTRLLSPVLDLSDGGDYTVSYARWLRSYNGSVDQMVVEISNNNGSSWTTVETVSDSPGWTTHSFNVDDFVTPTATVRVRFTVNDNPNDSVTEGGLDAFVVSGLSCEEFCIADGDMDGLGGCNGDDIQLFVEGLLGTLAPEVECHGDFAAPIGTLDSADIPGMVSALLSGS